MNNQQCPYCGKLLEKGFIQSARPIFYDQKERSIFFRPNKKTINLTGGIFDKTTTSAYVCKECQVVIVNY